VELFGLVFIGKRMVNLVPFFGVVLNVIELLWLSRMAFVMVSPSPVPLFSCLVVKKGSNMLF